jgi:hypothetical protein
MRVIAKIPTEVIDRLSGVEATVNKQIAQKLENFYWDGLPYESDIDCGANNFKQMTVQLSKQTHDALRKYCRWNSKSKTVAIAQALAKLGV